VALACVPAAIPAGERAGHFALARHLFNSAAQERRDLPDGWEVRFPADAFGQVARFVDLERRCCPFLSFTIEIEGAGRGIRLRLTGPEGTREFLQAELSQ
jgi:hypothetical protein